MFLPIIRQKLNSNCTSFIVLNNKTLNYGRILLLRRQTLSSSNTDYENKVSSNSFEKYLVKNHPKIHGYYVMTVNGSKSCFSDAKIYLKLRKQLFMKERKLEDLSISELLVYLQFPADFAYIIFLMMVIEIPIIGEAIIALGIFFPQFVLTRHFWTHEQLSQFQLNELKQNEGVNFPIMLKQLTLNNKNLLDQLPFRFSQLSTKNLDNLPKLDELYFTHLILLKRLHKVSPLPFGTSSLIKRSLLLKLLDSKLAANDGKLVQKLNEKDLQLHLYIRKLNYNNMDITSMRNMLNNWLKHCSTLPPSVYLYAPFLVQTKR